MDIYLIILANINNLDAKEKIILGPFILFCTLPRKNYTNENKQVIGTVFCL